MNRILSNWFSGVMDWASNRILPSLELHTRIDVNDDGVKSLVVTMHDREIRLAFEEATQMVGEQARYVALDMKVRGDQLVTRIVGVFDAAKGAWVNLAPSRPDASSTWRPTTRPILHVSKRPYED